MTQPRFLKAATQAIGQSRRYPLTILALYGFNLLATLLCLYPFWVLFNAHSKRSLIGELPGGLLNGHVLVELMEAEQSGFRLVLPWLFLCGIGMFLGQLYLAGGVAAVVARGDGDQWRRFHRAGTYFLPRFLILALWMLPFLALIPIAAAVLEGVLTLIVGPDIELELGSLATQLRMGVVVIIAFALKQLFALARLQMVRRPNRSSLACLAAALRFCFTQFPAVLGCLLIFGTGYALLGFSLAEFRPSLPAHGMLLVLIHQLWVLLKKGWDLSLTQAEWLLLDGYAGQTATINRGIPPVRRIPGL